MQSIKKLLKLCDEVSGMTILELANLLQIAVPTSLIHNKGWIGQLLEIYLGAKSGNLPITDFPEIGIELKTIPVNSKTLLPLESTFICMAPLQKPNISWEMSVVKLKLSNVLWIPIECDKQIHFTKRRIGKAFLWRPSQKELQILQQDWQELTELMTLGEIQLLSAKYGRYLQIRPKAINCNKNLSNYITIEGTTIKTVNRGFYLRSSFTKTILANYFVC